MVSDDHCFGRIVLDHAVGGRWYDVLDRRRSPAFAQLTDEQLATAVALAERVLAEGDPLLRAARRAEPRLAAQAAQAHGVTLLVGHLALTAAYAGFQWTVRVLVYPQFAQVPPDAFAGVRAQPPAAGHPGGRSAVRPARERPPLAPCWGRAAGRDAAWSPVLAGPRAWPSLLGVTPGSPSRCTAAWTAGVDPRERAPPARCRVRRPSGWRMPRPRARPGRRVGRSLDVRTSRPRTPRPHLVCRRSPRRLA